MIAHIFKWAYILITAKKKVEKIIVSLFTPPSSLLLRDTLLTFSLFLLVLSGCFGHPVAVPGVDPAEPLRARLDPRVRLRRQHPPGPHAAGALLRRAEKSILQTVTKTNNKI